MAQTSNFTVTIMTPELRYAVMNKTHVTARSLEAGGKMNYEAAAHMQASEDPENSYELVRAITSAIAETKVELGEYLNEEHSTADNMIPGAVEQEELELFSATKAYAIGDKVKYDDTTQVNHSLKGYQFNAAHSAGAWNASQVDEVPLDQIQLGFFMPSNFNSASSEALGAGVHDFIVGRTIYAWYRQTVPEIAAACKADADEILIRVKKALYQRKRPSRPYSTAS